MQQAKDKTTECRLIMEGSADERYSNENNVRLDIF